MSSQVLRQNRSPLVVLATAGTLGDLWPVLSLGQTLLQRGVRVRLSAPKSFLPHARMLGIETCESRPHVTAHYVRRHAGSWDHWGKMESGELLWGCPDVIDLKGRYSDLMAAVQGAELFIPTSTQFLGSLVAEKTGIPSLTIAISPQHVASLPGSLNSVKSQFLESSITMPPLLKGKGLVHLGEHLREFRSSIGLSGESKNPLFCNSPVIAAISSHFCEPDREKFPDIAFTGFWFYQRPEWNDWLPSRTFERFLEKGTPPLVLTFSSLPLCDSESVLKTHAQAAMLLSRRLVIISGWAGFDKRDIPQECRGEVIVVGELPHQWLFMRSAAVIHHGGIGTLAESLRCRKPMLIEPYGNDQFFNASRAIKLGIGAAAHPHRMTPEALARLLDSKVLSPETSQRVSSLAENILKDSGVEYAADLVMARL